jgi:hypothetical protein
MLMLLKQSPFVSDTFIYPGFLNLPAGGDRCYQAVPLQFRVAPRRHRDNDVNRKITAVKLPIVAHFQHGFMVGIDNKNRSRIPCLRVRRCNGKVIGGLPIRLPLHFLFNDTSNPTMRTHGGRRRRGINHDSNHHQQNNCYRSVFNLPAPIEMRFNKPVFDMKYYTIIGLSKSRPRRVI